MIPMWSLDPDRGGLAHPGGPQPGLADFMISSALMASEYTRLVLDYDVERASVPSPAWQDAGTLGRERVGSRIVEPTESSRWSNENPIRPCRPAAAAAPRGTGGAAGRQGRARAAKRADVSRARVLDGHHLLIVIGRP